MHIGKVWWQFETSKWSLEKTSLWKKIATKSFLQIKKYNVQGIERVFDTAGKIFENDSLFNLQFYSVIVPT